MPVATIPSTRAQHAQRILRLVHGGVVDTRQGIAEATGMSISLVSRVTADLLRGRLLEAHADDASEGPGRPTERLALHPGAGRTLGLEVARDRLTFVSCDATGGVHARWSEDADRHDVSEGRIAWLAERILAGARAAGDDAPPWLGVGVALHDVVTAGGDWLRADVQTEAVPARSLLSDRLAVPVVVDDVSRSFAEAEHRFGAGRDAPDMLYLFLGRDGVGSGIFAGDVLLRSASGICGEIGHIPVVADGRRCSCGNRGCLETVATHPALLRQVREYLDQGVRSRLRHDGTIGEFHAAAMADDKVATLVLHDLASYLATSLTGSISVTGATTVVLGGDVRGSGPSLPTLLREELRRTLLQPLAARVEVRYAELDEWAGAHGVAVAALDQAVRSGHLVHVRMERGNDM